MARGRGGESVDSKHPIQDKEVVAGTGGVNDDPIQGDKEDAEVRKMEGKIDGEPRARTTNLRQLVDTLANCARLTVGERPQEDVG